MDAARRHLLKLGFLSAASAALPLEALGQHLSKSAPTSVPPTATEYDALSYLTADDFKPFVGVAFTAISQTSGSVRVILAEVQSPPTLAASTKKTAASLAPAQQTFALRFKSGSGQPLKQGTYVFHNSSFAPFAMFVVPSAKGAQPMFYTGQVNRSIQ
jgi:hypothetical protein